MGLFDFLSNPTGIAQAAAGAEQGLLRGQAQGVQQHQLQAMDQYRQAQLASLNQNRQQRLTQGQHDAQAKFIAPLIKSRFDPNNSAYWQRNPDEAAKIDRVIAAHSEGYAADPGDIFSVKPPPNMGDQMPPGGAAPPDSPAPPAAPVDTPGLPQGAVPFDYGAPPPDAASLSDTGLAGPRSYDTPFGPAPSTQLLPNPKIPSVFSGEPAGGLPQQAPEPTTAPAGGPGGAGATQNPAAPHSLAGQLRQEFQAGPRKGETDKAFNTRIASAAKIAGIDLREVLTGAQVPMLNSLTGRNNAQAGLDRTKTAEEQLSFEPKMENLTARTEGVRATTAQTKALTPVRVAQGNQAIAKSKADVETAQQRAQTDADRLRMQTDQGNRRIDLEQKAQASLNALRAVQKRHLDLVMKNSQQTKMTPEDRLGYQKGWALYTQQNQFGAAQPDDVRRQGLVMANRIAKSYGLPEISDASLGVSAGQQPEQTVQQNNTLGPTHGSTGAPAASTFSKQQLAGAVQAINAGKMHDALRLHPELRPLLQEAWRRTQKQPWPG